MLLFKSTTTTLFVSSFVALDLGMWGSEAHGESSLRHLASSRGEKLSLFLHFAANHSAANHLTYFITSATILSTMTLIFNSAASLSRLTLFSDSAACLSRLYINCLSKLFRCGSSPDAIIKRPIIGCSFPASTSVKLKVGVFNLN
nr:hypothetical protein Iba_chr12aCG23930 [Ipomoea batatas]